MSPRFELSVPNSDVPNTHYPALVMTYEQPSLFGLKPDSSKTYSNNTSQSKSDDKSDKILPQGECNSVIFNLAI